MKKLFGVTTAMVTPLDANDKVDVKALKEHTDFLIKKGVNCLYPNGSTGEMYFLSVEERKLVAETVVKEAAGRANVFIHVGAMTLKDTLELARHAHEIGADGIGVVTPSYFSVTDREMEEYYVAVSKSLPDDFPMYLYCIPQCAGNDLKPDVVQRIADRCKNVVGIKYSFADFLRVKDYLNTNNGNFSVMVGTDRLFSAALTMGCDGTVSGVSSVYPEPFVNVYKAFGEKNLEAVRKYQNLGNQIAEILKSGANMAYFKTGLEFRGMTGGHMRKPLLDLSKEEKSQLIPKLEKFDKLIK